MGELKKQLHISRTSVLKASSLIETIVASIIFLAVFAISLMTLTRLTTGISDNSVYVDVDYAIAGCFRKFGDGKHLPGSHDITYDWGNISVNISGYKDFPSLQEITILVDIKSEHKQIEYKHIVESTHE